MKKLLCFLLCLILIFSSISLCFAADWSSSDSQNLSNAASRLYYMNQSAAYYLYNIASNTNNIYNKCVDIYNALFYGNHNITYWVNSISTWMSPIYNSITNIPVDLSTIIGALMYTDDNGNGVPYMQQLRLALTNYYNGKSSIADYQSKQNAHYNLLNNYGSYTYAKPLDNGGYIGAGYSHKWQDGTPLGNIALLLKDQMNNDALIYQYRWAADLAGYNTTQNVLSWNNLNSTYTFTPSSSTDGIYKFLSSIQAPVARLSYVLASDERIEAQEASSANEQAVVDNFIDSSGDGAASPSDIGSMSDLSSGYKQNFGTDASPSGIFDIFNSDHATWFSQETKNQLDTTTPSRMTKGSVSETPLLDKQIEDIYNALGVKQP